MKNITHLRIRIILDRRSRSLIFHKIGVVENFAKFAGKHLCKNLFLNKIAGFQPATTLKKRLWHRCFPMNFGKFSRTPFYRTSPGNCFCNIIKLKKCNMSTL